MRAAIIFDRTLRPTFQLGLLPRFSSGWPTAKAAQEKVAHRGYPVRLGRHISKRATYNPPSLMLELMTILGQVKTRPGDSVRGCRGIRTRLMEGGKGVCTRCC